MKVLCVLLVDVAVIVVVAAAVVDDGDNGDVLSVELYHVFVLSVFLFLDGPMAGGKRLVC